MGEPQSGVEGEASATSTSMATTVPVKAARAGAGQSATAEAWYPQEFDCPVCYQLFHEPITLPCGHTFCRSCVQRSLDFQSQCPCCRAVCYVRVADAQENWVIASVMKAQWPEAVRARAATHNAEEAASRDWMPLFPIHAAFPGEYMRLHIFEPRYRLMIRRCLAANRRFGMCGELGNEWNVDVATIMVIEQVAPLPDGRFLLTVRGEERVRLLEVQERDGIKVGRTEPLQDEQISSAEEESGVVDRLLSSTLEATLAWRARLARCTDDGVAAMLARTSPHPPEQAACADFTRYVEAVSFWAGLSANLCDFERVELKRVTSAMGRLHHVYSKLRGRLDAVKGGAHHSDSDSTGPPLMNA